METKKITIKILDYKDTSASRTTFETNLGKMSAFKNEGSDLIKDLKDHTNCLISVGMCETNKDGHLYKNIREFYGKVAGSSDPVPNGVEVIEPKKFMKEPVWESEENDKIMRATKHDLFNERDKDTSFYTAYAKDVFIAMYNIEAGCEETMAQAIDLVKQARDAFSQ